MLLQSQPTKVAVHWAGDSASLAIEAPICNHATAVQRAWRATDVSRRELWYLSAWRLNTSRLPNHMCQICLTHSRTGLD